MKISNLIYSFWPRSVYFIFLIIILFATLYFQPGWGFMDDFGNLGLSNLFWQSHHKLNEYFRMVNDDVVDHGRFRPLYFAWIILVYKLFQSAPVGIYILITLIGFMVLFLWGKIIAISFDHKGVSQDIIKYLYPLMFFVFTPFWNNFMYISIQEKFIYFLSPVAIYFFFQAYMKGKIKYFICSVFWSVAALLSKETALVLIAVFFAYSLLDLVLFKRNLKLSRVVCAVSALFLFFYGLFLKSILGGYTEKYNQNLNVESVWKLLFNTPALIKVLFLSGLVYLIYYCISFYHRKTKDDSLSVIFPLFLIGYILLLIPWGIINYLLAPLAPLILIMFFPIYRWLVTSDRWIKVAVQSLMVGLIFLIQITIIIPRISKMADKRKIVEFLKYSKNDNINYYYYPPPYIETAELLGKFSDLKVQFLDQNIIFSDIFNQPGSHYLLVNDESLIPEVVNVDIGNEVYQNNTWKIFKLEASDKSDNKLNIQFNKNFVQEFKHRIRDL